MVDIGKLMLDQYEPLEVSIDCFRCRRHAHATVAVLRKKFGNQRLAVIPACWRGLAAGFMVPAGSQRIRSPTSARRGRWKSTQ